jgi:hypothetical protein
MRRHGKTTYGRFRIAAIAILLAGPVACGKAQESPSQDTTPAPSPPPATATPAPVASSFQKAIQKAMMLSAKRQVTFAIVTSDGHVFPEQLVAKKDIHWVVWIADGDTLDIQFKGSSPKFETKCEGPICWTTAPPNVLSPAGNPFPYGGTITVGGNAIPFDPRLEVVK